MQVNEELKIILSAEVTKLKQNIDKAKKEVANFKDKVKEASKEVDSKFKAMGTGIANGAKAAATGIAAAGAAILALGASTAEYRAEQAKLVTSFEAAGGSAAEAKETYNDLFRVLGDSGQATEAAAHLAKLTTEEKALSEWTNICQGVYATFGDSIPIEGLTEAANETAKTGALTGSLADALNWAGIKEDDFAASLEACNGEAEREALIRETLSGIYGEAAAKYEENNAQVLAQNEAQAKLQDTMAKVGEAVAPVITLFTSLAADALAAVTPYIQNLAEQYLPVLKELLEGVGAALSNTIKWIQEHSTLLATIGTLVGIIVVAIGAYNAVAAIKAAMAALEVTSVWGLVAAYAAQAAAMIVAIAPYVLIVAAIAAVIAIIVLCVKHWDTIKAAVAKAWDWIKDKTKAAVDAVVGWFNKMMEKASKIFESIKNIASTVFGAIKSVIVNYITMAKNIVLSIFDGIKNGIQNRIETVKNVISNIVKLIKSIFTGDFGAAKEAVLGIFDSIKDGIKNRIENAKNTVKNVINAIKGFFNFSWSLPKLKMPKLSITGKFSLSPLQVPKFSISWHKLGGVFEEPTLFNYGGSVHGLGENGAEMIAPLENNLEWLDKLAGMLSNRMGSTPVVLNVDGKVFAQTAINTINQQTRQTGKLALNLV